MTSLEFTIRAPSGAGSCVCPPVRRCRGVARAVARRIIRPTKGAPSAHCSQGPTLLRLHYETVNFGESRQHCLEFLEVRVFDFR